MSTYRPRCKWCGSDNLVWRHDAGLLVCADCGGVLETLFESPRGYDTQGVIKARIHDYEDDLSEIIERGWNVRWIHGKPVGEHPLNDKARRIVESLGIEKELRLVESDAILKARPYRSRVAFALYLHLLSRGYTPGRAVGEAASLIGVNRSHLESSIRKYRSRIQRLAIRAVKT